MKTVWQLFNVLKMKLPHDLAIPLLFLCYLPKNCTQGPDIQIPAHSSMTDNKKKEPQPKHIQCGTQQDTVQPFKKE